MYARYHNHLRRKPPETKECMYCFEPIDIRAKICPECSFRQPPPNWKTRKQMRIGGKVTRYIHLSEWGAEWIAYWLNRVTFLDVLARASIAVALVLWLVEAPARTEQRHNDAWQVVYLSAQVGGGQAAVAALEELNREGVSLSGVKLQEFSLEMADLHEADLGEANLEGAKLSRANLVGADLNETNLSGANLILTGLFEANLSGANLGLAGLTEADLRGTNLWRANLWEADLRGTKLGGAFLSEANLAGGDLSGAIYNTESYQDEDGAIKVGN